MRNLFLKYMPAVLVRLFKYFWHGTAFFGLPVVTSVIKSIVDDNADDLNVMRGVLGPE